MFVLSRFLLEDSLMFNNKQLPRFAGQSARSVNSVDNAVTRRQFFIASALIGTSLVIGCASTESGEKSAAKAAAPPPISPFDAYLSIDAESGAITVYSSQFDMGQHVYHGIATLVAEELNVNVQSLKVLGKAGNPAAYGNPMMGGAFQLTGGSSSMPGSWQRYRQAGAVARTLLLQAAAAKLSVPVSELIADDGQINHAKSARSLRYPELVADAAKLPIPADVTLKTPEQFQQIGREQKWLVNGAEKAHGQLQYTIDLQLPKQRVATVVHSPRFGGTVKSFDASKARAIAGVVDVVKISTGIAVIAEHTWAAFQGAGALAVEWENAQAETRSDQQILDDYVVISSQAGLPSTQKGDAAKALGKAAKTIEAVYRFPYLAHAAMEPLNALAYKFTPPAAPGQSENVEQLHLYGGLQMPDVVQATCAAIAGVKPEQVILHVMPTGGGFGRRAVADADVFVEATEIAKAIGFAYPIKLQWMRTTDTAAGRYRPAHVHRVKVGLTADGKVSGWQHHIVGQSILKGTPFESMLKEGVDESATEGVHNTPYQLPDFNLQVTHPNSAVSVLWWRSVGHTHTAYVMETMIDEIASSTGIDPVALRLQLLAKDARERAVLQLAADKAGWKQARQPGRFMGIAVHSSFGSFVATVAEISKRADGTIKVERCIVASDCGIVINPDVVRAQLEGGTGFGLGAILAEAVVLENGAAVTQNYDSYKPLRIDGMPIIESYLLPSKESPTGIGECAVPPIGPALANAIFQATGQRVRELPYLKA
jgi:isoquinoline 1-oxidoreductase subunit beta